MGGEIDDKTKIGYENSILLVGNKEVHTLSELRNTLENIQVEEFNNHVNEIRQDFQRWIKFSLNKPELAELISQENTKEGIAEMIDYYLAKEALAKAEEDPYRIPKTTWIRTEIPGFDELITNGIPKGSSILLSGGPGTGKTTFCLQLLNNAAVNQKKSLYLTFEEDPVNLRKHMINYGFDPINLEKNNLLIIKKMGTFDLSRSVEALLAKASGELTIELDEIDGVIPKGFNPKVIVLDSLSAVAAAFGGREESYRIYIEQLFTLFKKAGATSFLITEREQETNKYSKSGVEEFLADGVVVFYNIRNKNLRLSALEILKLRGTSHQKKIVPFKIISNKGIVVYPQEQAFT